MKILALVAAAVLAAPAAMAGWMSYGSFEPDVAEDVASGWMWADAPDPTQGKQVYFNAFGTVGQALVLLPAVNHNVGALETRFDATNQAFNAFLGVWQDCNGDGYVGLAETAAHAYRVELNLHDTTLCPQDTTSPQSHNDGVWVRELIPIGITNDATGSSEIDGGIDTAVYLDDAAMVWGDAGFPGEDLAATGSGGSCPISPLPRGTLQSTGGALMYVVCGFERFTTQPYNRVVGTVDPENEQGLAFEDPNDPRKGEHPLNRPTLGPEDSEERAFTVWDCTEGSETFKQEFPDPTGEISPDEPFTVTVPGVTPGAGPGTSYAGAINHTLEGTPGWDDCDTSNDAGADTYFLEGDHEGASTTSKNAANWNFRFYRAAFSGVCSDDVIFTDDGLCPEGGVALPNLGATDYGLQALQPALGTYWTSFAVLLGTTPGIPLRTGLGVDTDDPTASDLEPNPRTGAAPAYYTFYAYVGNANAGLVLPGGGATGVYANEWCGSATEGIQYGVDCDADNWNRNAADGSEQIVPTGTSKFAAPGTEYNLRDIDCYDSTFAGFEGDCATQPLPAPGTQG